MKIFSYDNTFEGTKKKERMQGGVMLDLVALEDLPEGAEIVGATMMKQAKDRISKTLPRFEVEGKQYTTDIHALTRPLGYAYLGENQWIEVHRDLANASILAVCIIATLIGILFSIGGWYY
jgi:hypothetical protein